LVNASKEADNNQN